MLENYLESLDTKAILEYYGVKKLFLSGEWWNGLCPFHSDRHPSFGMHTITKHYNCFVCGGGDLIDFVSKIEGIPRQEAIRKIYGNISLQYPDDEKANRRFNEKLLSILRCYEIPYLPAYNPEVIENWRFIHPYMVRRGFSDPRIFHYFKCGYSSKHQSLTFPVFWGDRLIGVQGRRVDDQKPKYKPIPGYEFPSSQVFYHFVPEYDRVLLVEGILDCIRLWQYGVSNVMAIFGSHLSDSQVQILLENFREVILWFDNDEAGRNGTRKAIRVLSPHLTVYIAEGIHGDPAEHSYREVLEVKKNLIPAISWRMKEVLA